MKSKSESKSGRYSMIADTFRQESGFRPFLVTVFAMALSYGLYKGVLDNFLAEIVGMGEFDRGIAEFFRELPGLMLVLVLAIFVMFSAERLYRIGGIIMLIGMAMHAVVPPGKVLITLAVCIYSLGEHIQLGMRNTLSLEYAREGKGGMALGQVSSVNQVGSLIGYAAIILAFMLVPEKGLTTYRGVFAVSSVICAVGALACFKMKGSSAADSSKRRFYFHKKYKKYYMLEIFYGARKQVFFTFGPYVLILFYGASAEIISLLFAVSAVACTVMSPVVGRIIDRFGYKIVMVMDTLILLIVCFFYGFAHHIFPKDIAFIVCCVNYILDSVISLASLASNVYVQDISDSPEETKATISTGVSVNHMITIMVALFGGWIWQTLGIETLFILSAVLGLCNSAYAATIKTNGKPKAEGKA